MNPICSMGLPDGSLTLVGNMRMHRILPCMWKLLTKFQKYLLLLSGSALFAPAESSAPIFSFPAHYSFRFGEVLTFFLPFFDYLFNVLLFHLVGSIVPVLSFNNSRPNVDSMHICHEFNPLFVQICKFFCNPGPTSYQHGKMLIIGIKDLIICAMSF